MPVVLESRDWWSASMRDSKAAWRAASHSLSENSSYVLLFWTAGGLENTGLALMNLYLFALKFLTFRPSMALIQFDV